MKYKDLIHFDPITSVVKLVTAGDSSVAERLVRTYVFSQKMSEDVSAVVMRNLNPNNTAETKGIQIVGSYGTGKSHLMSVVSIIAENRALLEVLNDEGIKTLFEPIAGRYKVLRFEIGTDKPLKDVVFATLLDNFEEGKKVSAESCTLTSNCGIPQP